LPNYFLAVGEGFAMGCFLITLVVAFATFLEPSSPEPVDASDISWVAVPSLPLGAGVAFLTGVAFGFGDAEAA